MHFSHGIVLCNVISEAKWFIALTHIFIQTITSTLSVHFEKYWSQQISSLHFLDGKKWNTLILFTSDSVFNFVEHKSVFINYATKCLCQQYFVSDCALHLVCYACLSISEQQMVCNNSVRRGLARITWECCFKTDNDIAAWRGKWHVIKSDLICS